MTNSIESSLLANAKKVFSIDAPQYRALCRALTGSCFIWNPDWNDELSPNAVEWNKLYVEHYENEHINEIVYFIIVGVGQPHDVAPKYSLMDFYKFVSLLIKKHPHIRDLFFQKVKIYIVRNFPSNLTILQNKANTNNPSLTVFTMHSSPLLNVSWPKISFASGDTDLHKRVAKFFENAMSPRYSKLINASRFLELYEKEGDWRKCVDGEPLKILVVNNAEPKVRDFVDPIIKFISYLEKTKYYLVSHKEIEYRDLLNEDCNKHDAIILSASPLGDDIVHNHKEKYYNWLSHIAKPVFGICAGHQIIGTYFGGKLHRGKEAENGYTDVNIVKDDPIFRSEKIPPTRQHHNDSVSCPDDFIILAESEKCRNQIMKHKRKPIYSTQFHCEKNNRWLLESFIALAEDVKYGVSTTSII